MLTNLMDGAQPFHGFLGNYLDSKETRPERVLKNYAGSSGPWLLFLAPFKVISELKANFLYPTICY